MLNANGDDTYTVKQARLLSGLSQREIADRMDVNVDTYRRIERDPGKATINNAKLFSSIVGIPIDRIFFA